MESGKFFLGVLIITLVVLTSLLELAKRNVLIIRYKTTLMGTTVFIGALVMLGIALMYLTGQA